MAILKDLIVHGPSHFIGKVFINDSHIAKINGSDVPENPKFTDTVSSMSTTGTGNAITGVSVSNGSFTFTKGSTFLTSQNTAALYAGTSAATANTSAPNTSAHLILKDGSTYNRIKIQGTAGIEVTASSNGILSIGVPAQSPNTFYAGPASGGASAIPNFRNIGLADLPIDNLRIGYDQIDDPKNLIINCENPVLDPVSARPRIEGDENSYVRFSEGTQSVVPHGVKITSTGAVRPFITFGSSVIGEGTLCGLTPGSTYTFSCKLKYKLLSGGDTATRYLRIYFMTNKADPSQFATEAQVNVQGLSTLLQGIDVSSKAVLTFTVPLEATKVYLQIICNQTTNSYYAAGDYIEATELKLEEGSIATPWENKSDLKIGGRNYFAICNSVKGYLYPDGTIHTEDTYKEYTCDYIPVSKGEVFTLSTKTLNQDDQPYLAYRFFDSGKNPIGTRTAGYVKCISNIEVPNGAAYIRASYRTHNGTATGKLELGSIPTDWTPAPQDLLNQVSEELSPQIEDASETANLALTEGIEYIVGTQTAATSSWEGKTRDSKTVIGKTIAYKLPVAGSTVGTTTLTLVDKTTGQTRYSGAVKMNDSPVTTHYPANSIIKLTYDGTNWRTDFYNTNTYLERSNTTASASFLPILMGNHATTTAKRTSSGYKDVTRFAYQPSTQTLKVGQVSATKYIGAGVSTGEIPDQPTDDTLPTSLAVQTAIDNIQIGGRNYLRNTRFFTGWITDKDITGNSNTIDGDPQEEIISHETGEDEDDPIEEEIIEENPTYVDDGVINNQSITINHLLGVLSFPSRVPNVSLEARSNYNVNYTYLRNKTITISAQVKASSKVPLSIMINPFVTDTEGGDVIRYRKVYLTSPGDGGGTSVKTFTPSKINTWEKVTATVVLNDGEFFTQGQTFNNYNECYFGARIARVINNSNAYQLRRPKIEIGNKATDWIPAIEDNEVDTAEIETKNNIFSGRLYNYFEKNFDSNNKLIEKSQYTGNGMYAWCKVEGNRKYTISRKINDSTYSFYYTTEYPKNGTQVYGPFLSFKANEDTYRDTISVPQNYNYIFIKVLPSNSTRMFDYNLKIEEGSNQTEWSHNNKDLLATPQMFGAFGDGLHDDTMAIQKALDACNNIFFPNGVYLVSYPLIVRTSCHVYGNGPMSKIRATATFSRENIPHGTNESKRQNNIYSFMNNTTLLGTSISYIFNYIDTYQGRVYGITSGTNSSLILENLTIDCNHVNPTGSSSEKNQNVGGIRILRTYNGGNIKNIQVVHTKQEAIFVGFPYSYAAALRMFARRDSSNQNKVLLYNNTSGVVIASDNQNNNTFWSGYKDRMVFDTSNYAYPSWYQATAYCTDSLNLTSEQISQTLNDPQYAEFRVFDLFHHAVLYSGKSAIKDYNSWRKDGSRSQSLSISGCIFDAGALNAQKPLGNFYNALETNIADTKFLLKSQYPSGVSAKNENMLAHNVACLYFNYSKDIYVRGCSFTNGKYGVFLDQGCDFFRLIGNTYERMAKNSYNTGCYCIRVVGENKDSLGTYTKVKRGIIIEMPYYATYYNSDVRLEHATKIQILGGFENISQLDCDNIITNLTG